MTNLCRSARCARHLGGPVVFCPFCGSSQRAVPLSRHTSSEPVQAQQNAPLTPQPADVPQTPDLHAPVDQCPVHGLDESVTAHGVGTGAGIRSPAGWRQIFHGWMWFAVLAAAVLLILTATGVNSPATSGVARTAESCDGAIESELAFFVDIPGAVAESTTSETLVRLGEELDAPFTGVRRISLFSTRHRGATPLIAVCTRPRFFSALLGRHGTDAALRSRIVGAVHAELGRHAVPGGSQTLTQLLTDVSVSTYGRSPMNTLVIFSGLRETWPGFDPHHCGGVQAAVAAYRTVRAGGVERPAFKNVAIHLNVIPEPGAGLDVARCRRGVWNWYFGDVDGKSEGVSWDYLPGSMSDAKQPTEKE
jgi:hypothetical protein